MGREIDRNTGVTQMGKNSLKPVQREREKGSENPRQQSHSDARDQPHLISKFYTSDLVCIVNHLVKIIWLKILLGSNNLLNIPCISQAVPIPCIYQAVPIPLTCRATKHAVK